MSPRDWSAVSVILAAVSILFAGLRLYQVKATPPPERVRKLFHLIGGVLGLPLPWIFDHLAPVLVLSAISAGAFLAMRLSIRLRHGVGQVLFGVKRESIGELCYVASIVLLFWLARGDKVLYAVPLLLLALADTAAALVGEEYGRLMLHTAGGRKSIEGAVAFFFIAFFCVHVPVLIWGGTGRLESLLIAMNLSVMVMMAEAAAWWGLDNLIVPLWGYILLRSQLHMDAFHLSLDLAFVLGLVLLIWMWRNRTTLADDTLCGAGLWGYVVWAVGGWLWFLAPLILLLSSVTTNTFRTPADQSRMFRFPVVLALIAGSIFWLVAYRQTSELAVFYPFISCFAADVAIIAMVRHKFALPDLGWPRAISTNVAKSTILVIPCVLAIDGFTVLALFDIGACIASVFAATALFYRLQPSLSSFPVDGSRWIRQASIVAVTSTLALGIHNQAAWGLGLPTHTEFVTLLLP